MKRFIKVLKITGLVFLIIVISIIFLFKYQDYKMSLVRKQELAFATQAEWKWHDKSDGIQIYKMPKSNKSVLRKVHLKANYVVYAYKNNDLSLAVLVVFVVDCEPNTEITTSLKFPDGTPKKLLCNEAGDAFTFQAKYSRDQGTNVIWNEDFDGFKVYENFNTWDFTELDKEVTLLKAKPVPDK